MIKEAPSYDPEVIITDFFMPTIQHFGFSNTLSHLITRATTFIEVIVLLGDLIF